MADGKVEIDVDLNSKNVDSQANKLGSTLKNGVGRASNAAIKTFAAVGTAGVAALGTVSTMAVKSYSDYEQLTGGIDTLFKKSYDRVMKYANNAYKTAGMSANQYMETATSFSASLLQGLQGDTEKAAKYADKAITDMSDNANKMGTDISLIQNAYQGFAKQNYTMLDNLKLGYGGTAAEMARLVNDSGVMGEKFKATSKNLNEVSFDKMIEAIHIVQDNLGITGTTAKEASDTIEGSINSMKGAWENLLTGMADGNQNFDELFSNFIDSVHTVIKNIEPVAEQAASSCVKFVASALDEIASIIPDIAKKLPSMVMPLISSFGNLGLELISSLLGDQVKIALKDFVNEISQQVPTIVKQGSVGLETLRKCFSNMMTTIIEVASVALPLLISAFSFLMEHMDALTPLVTVVLQVLQSIIGFIPQIITAISPLIAVIINAASFVVPLLISALKVLNDNLSWVIPTLTKVLKSIDISPIQKLFDVIGKNVIPIVKNLIGIIKQLAYIVANAIGAVIEVATPIITVVINVASYIVPLLSSAIQFLNENLYWLVPTLGAVAAAMTALWLANNWQLIIVTIAQMLESVLVPVITKLFALIAAHPLMTLITGVTALTAAIVAYNMSASDATPATEAVMAKTAQLNEKISATRESIDEMASSYQSLSDASAQRIADIDTEFAQTESYWNELKKITDENGNIKKGYEDRAAFITGELSSALGTEISIVDNQIQDYKKLNGSIEKTIAMKRLEATIDAKTQEYNKAKEEEVQLAANQADAQKQYNDATSHFMKLSDERGKKIAEGTELTEAETEAWAEAAEAQGKAQQNLSDATDQLTEAQTTISNYDKAVGSVGKSAKKMNKASEDLATGFKKYGNVSTEALEKQADSAIENFDKIKKAYDEGNTSITKKQVNTAKNQAEKALKQYRKCGKNTVAGYVNGINEKKGELSDAVITMVNEALEAGKKEAKINSPSKRTAEMGKWLAKGYVKGFEEEDPARRITQTFRHSMRSIDNAMNGEVIHTMKLGGFDSIGDAMVHSLQKAGLTVQIGDREFGRIVRSVT